MHFLHTDLSWQTTLKITTFPQTILYETTYSRLIFEYPEKYFYVKRSNYQAMTNDIETVKNMLSHFAQLDEDDFNLSLTCWKIHSYKKGEIYNPVGSICRYLGFTMEGYFRSWLPGKNGEEINLFLFPPHGVVVTYKSFIHQSPCEYNTVAMTDARAICIQLADLQSLYKRSHGWERFGRLMAEKAFDIAVDRAESFVFKSAEQRYKELVEMHPDIIENIPLYHISSYLGIAGPSLSRIRKRMMSK